MGYDHCWISGKLGGDICRPSSPRQSSYACFKNVLNGLKANGEFTCASDTIINSGFGVRCRMFGGVEESGVYEAAILEKRAWCRRGGGRRTRSQEIAT